METEYSTSNLTNIDKYIETTIEKKIGQLIDVLPSDKNVQLSKQIQDLTIGELYNGTIQTLIDVINELSAVMSERKYMSNESYRTKLYEIFAKKERKLFIGIVMVVLSFILYFIDGSDA